MCIRDRYKPVPFLIVASFWYLVLTSILMVGQYYVERHFAKGVGARPDVQRPTVETGVVEAVGLSSATESGGRFPTSTSGEGGEQIVPPHSRPGGGGA